MDTTAHEAIRNLKARYFRYLDTRRWQDLQALLCDDFVGDYGPSDEEQFASPEAFIEAMQTNLKDATTVVAGGSCWQKWFSVTANCVSSRTVERLSHNNRGRCWRAALRSVPSGKDVPSDVDCQPFSASVGSGFTSSRRRNLICTAMATMSTSTVGSTASGGSAAPA